MCNNSASVIKESFARPGTISYYCQIKHMIRTMKKLYPKTLYLPCLVLALCFSSCVDKEYDWGKLDPEITVLKTGISYPLGVHEKRTLGDLLKLDDSSIVKVDENGDYYLKYEPEPVDVSVKVSENGELSRTFKPLTYQVNSIPACMKGEKPDHVPFLPLVMQYAAQKTGVNVNAADTANKAYPV